MHIAYLIYQAERPRSAAERRTEDIYRGELAKSLSRVLRGRGQARQAPAACVPAQRASRAACRPA
jgi:hypothetical protein